MEERRDRLSNARPSVQPCDFGGSPRRYAIPDRSRSVDYLSCSNSIRFYFSDSIYLLTNLTSWPAWRMNLQFFRFEDWPSPLHFELKILLIYTLDDLPRAHFWCRSLLLIPRDFILASGLYSSPSVRLGWANVCLNMQLDRCECRLPHLERVCLLVQVEESVTGQPWSNLLLTTHCWDPLLMPYDCMTSPQRYSCLGILKSSILFHIPRKKKWCRTVVRVCEREAID